MQLRNMYKVFKSYELDNPSQYDWFRKFSNPCYGMNVKVDVTEVVKTSKESGTSFFANVLFLLTTALNSVPEMRMREVNNEIRLYDVINPTFTVMTDSGKFVNAGFKMTNDYKKFYDTTRRIIDEVGVTGATIEPVLDAPQLGHAQVAALTHHLGAQFVAIHAQSIIGLVAHIGMRLLAGLHIGADTAIP